MADVSENYEESEEHKFAVKHLGDGKQLEDYWKHGKGAAKVRWGTKGSFTRCVAHIGKHVNPEYAKRICVQWEHDVTGRWPGEKK